MAGLSKKILVVGLAAVLALAWCDGAMARKKHRVAPHPKPQVSRDSGLPVDYDGTPIIMEGFHRTRPSKETAKRPERSVRIPRGSSTYVPPPNPSPDSPNSPGGVLNQPVVQPYKPPPINSFSDRVTNCIHSFPLQGGVGNNPSNQQMYIRQCANQ